MHRELTIAKLYTERSAGGPRARGRRTVTSDQHRLHWRCTTPTGLARACQ